MKQTPEHSAPSIRTVIDIVLFAALILVLVASGAYLFKSQYKLVERTVKEQTDSKALNYFDTINTLMLTGGMAHRSIPRDKLLAEPAVLEARVIRGPGVTKYFGPGNPEQKEQDALDRRAMSGEHISELRDTDQGRVLTVLVPMRAQTDYRGTNCMACHVVPEGEVLGAVRIDYSLSHLDEMVSEDVWWTLALMSVFAILGIVAVSLLLGRVVVRPLRYFSECISEVERNADLGRRIEGHNFRKFREFLVLGTTMNAMMERFSQSIQEVALTNSALLESARQLTEVNLKNSAGMERQQQDTELVSQAMLEVDRAVAQVAEHAVAAAEAAQKANNQSRSGNEVVQQTTAAIRTLADDVIQSTEAMQKLSEYSSGIGRVVDVISGIAEQTNLLALNAAIEAARAGEQGRGFAVVADEVRTLASRTQESTKEIQHIVEQLQGAAGSVLRLMGESREQAEVSVAEANKASQSLQQITDSVEIITRMNIEISTLSASQQQATRTMDENVRSIREVTDETAESAKHATQGTRQLAEMAQRLGEVVARFKY
jgi:methyl-accepting chemotaxis protein